jgi:LacI family transcriptional regulator
MSSKTVTLEQVARMAGVSPSTVSRILNGTAVVSDDKRQAVDDAVRRLGFVPNPVARGLAGGRTFSIGVVTQAIDSPFYGGTLRGIEDKLSEAGYSPLFVSGHWDATAEARCIDTLRSRRVDGIVVLTGRLSDAALRTLSAQLPVVVTGRKLRAPNLVALDFDNFEGAQLATRHLLNGGHRQIAFIGGDPVHPDSRDRHRGYMQALADADVPYQPSLVLPGSYHEEDGRTAIEALLAAGTPFTAVFASNDQMATGALLALHRRGLRVPQDVSLVGFDDLPGSMYAVPPLTTVRQPAYVIGEQVALAMLGLLRGTAPQVAMPPPTLVTRESSQPLVA